MSLDRVRGLLNEAWRNTPIEERAKPEWIKKTYRQLRQVIKENASDNTHRK